MAASKKKKLRSEAAKRGWKTRMRGERARAKAAKKGWETRRQKETKAARVTKHVRHHVTKLPNATFKTTPLRFVPTSAAQHKVSEALAAVAPHGFRRGPAFAIERTKLRSILHREPTEAEVMRAVELRPKRLKKKWTFDEVMERAKARGVLDRRLFDRIARRFGVGVSNVYDVFFGYPPRIGKAA